MCKFEYFSYQNVNIWGSLMDDKETFRKTHTFFLFGLVNIKFKL